MAPRAHLTLQDRLVKELRLRGLSTPDGRIEVFHEGQRLPCRVFFNKEPRITDADIVANKRLA